MNWKEYIERKIMPVTETGCWIWLGASGRHGYGRAVIKGKRYAIHRVSYQEYKGPIPDGMEVCHKCDIPSCVNPNHLFVGTHKDNLVDASIKNRLHKGERCSWSKLTIEQVREIKKSSDSMYKLGKRYGVHTGTIKSILDGRSWKLV